MMVAKRWAALGFFLCALILEAAAQKRAPVGFQGMRGKKNIDYLQDDEIKPNEDSVGFYDNFGGQDPLANGRQFAWQGLLKRVPMGFQGMRGKKLSENYYGNYLDSDYFENLDYNKRAPMGFQGMRGKKLADYAYNFKRAPMGFQGMRGKKDLSDVIDTLIEEKQDENKQNGMPEEAQPLMGDLPTFTPFGMAGHKERRSPNYGFFGMRGKKMPSASSFFGMRGKKGPFDYPFRGKFVGVRGKKSQDSLIFDDDSFEKRAPSGFVASRGKKRDIQDEENMAEEVNKSISTEK